MLYNSFFELGGRHWILTTDHPASCWNKPILVETDRRGEAILSEPIGPGDCVILPAELPRRSLGLEVEPVRPDAPLRAYAGREIATYGVYPETVAAYLSQEPPDEISQEMLRAGVESFVEHDPRFEGIEEAVVRIFKAMDLFRKECAEAERQEGERC